MKPRLSRWQIWNMCVGILGIQFGFALMNSNVSRIFQTLGAEVADISLLWIAAPLTGLIVQPLIGYYSDRTWTWLGRRRPFFLAAATLAALAMFVMPNAPGLWIAAGTFWIMDTSMNASQEPFRAFIGDKLPNEQRTLGFAVQSFFVGIGAISAAALPWLLSNLLDVANTAPAGVIPDTVRMAFYTGSALILVTVLWSIVSTSEYSPEEMNQFHEEDPTVFHVDEGVGLRQIFRDLGRMPREMKQLAVVQFFSWFGMISLWIYGTAAVTSWHFDSSDVTSEIYNRGANWLGVLIASYNGVAAAFALFIPAVVRRLGSRGAHCLHMVLGGVCLAAFWFVREPLWLMPLMVGVGVAWASILSIPYSMLSSILPHRKMGIYMGFFNYFVVLPQILAAVALSGLLRWLFDGQAIFAIVLGGLSLVLAGLAVLRVDASADLGRKPNDSGTAA